MNTVAQFRLVIYLSLYVVYTQQGRWNHGAVGRTITLVVKSVPSKDLVLLYFCTQIIQLCFKDASEQILVGTWCLKYEKKIDYK